MSHLDDSKSPPMGKKRVTTSRFLHPQNSSVFRQWPSRFDWQVLSRCGVGVVGKSHARLVVAFPLWAPWFQVKWSRRAFPDRPYDNRIGEMNSCCFGMLYIFFWRRFGLLVEQNGWWVAIQIFLVVDTWYLVASRGGYFFNWSESRLVKIHSKDQTWCIPDTWLKKGCKFTWWLMSISFEAKPGMFDLWINVCDSVGKQPSWWPVASCLAKIHIQNVQTEQKATAT